MGRSSIFANFLFEIVEAILYNWLELVRKRLKMDISKRLKIARKAVGYTLDEVAQNTGIAKSSLSEFENSRREPKFSHLSKLAEQYRRTIEFFLTEEPLVENIFLWREKSDDQKSRIQAEVEFQQLCEQYHNLEIITNELNKTNLPVINERACSPEDFSFEKAEDLASTTYKDFGNGEIPGAALKSRLEEKYCVKIFYLDFKGSAISTLSSEYGPAIMLNSQNKKTRRSFDLAHELFHILTWKLFRKPKEISSEPSQREETLANIFASKLLMPEDVLKHKINQCKNSSGGITIEKLQDISREFVVSTEALFWRLNRLYNWNTADTKKYIQLGKQLNHIYRPIESQKPDKYPERYCDLARRALNEGKLSLLQFAKYMELTYKEAEKYLTDENDVSKKEIQISIT